MDRLRVNSRAALRRAASSAAPSEPALTQPLVDSEDEGDSLPRGHAIDVLQLWDSSWYGAGPRAKGGAARRKGSPRGVAPSGSNSQLKHASETSTPSSGQQTGGSSGAQQSPFLQPGEPLASGRHQPSAPLPALQSKPPPEALAVQQLPGIGTWAGRQRLFARPADLRDLPRSPSSGASPAPLDAGSEAGTPTAAAVVGGASPTDAAAGGGGEGGGALASGCSSVRSEQAREAAWRWRFTRKWEAEQKKYYEEAPGGGVGSLISNDEMDAIQYTQACGVGGALQFKSPSGTPLNRTLSRQSDGGGSNHLHHSLSCQFDVSGHGGSLALGALGASVEGESGAGGAGGLGSERPPRPRPKGVAPWLSPAEAAQPSATNQVLSMVTKARDLMQKQQQIEAEAQSRWELSMNGGCDAAQWVGQHLRPVQISMSGRFRFVLLRVSDTAGRHRYFVRGHSKATPAELLEEAIQEAAALARQKGLPTVLVESAGSGVMEWREDTDRHLHLSAAPPSGDAISAGRLTSSPTKKGAVLGDVTALTASLVRQELPYHFQVSTSTAPSRLATLMDTLRI